MGKKNWMTWIDPEVFKTPLFTWLTPCKPCPAHWWGGDDPESRDIISWGSEEARKHLYSCAWRKGGYCMGQSWKYFEEFGHRGKKRVEK